MRLIFLFIAALFCPQAGTAAGADSAQKVAVYVGVGTNITGYDIDFFDLMDAFSDLHGVNYFGEVFLVLNSRFGIRLLLGYEKNAEFNAASGSHTFYRTYSQSSTSISVRTSAVTKVISPALSYICGNPAYNFSELGVFYALASSDQTLTREIRQSYFQPQTTIYQNNYLYHTVGISYAYHIRLLKNVYGKIGMGAFVLVNEPEVFSEVVQNYQAIADTKPYFGILPVNVSLSLEYKIK